jgi:hypothetical protein
LPLPFFFPPLAMAAMNRACCGDLLGINAPPASS